MPVDMIIFMGLMIALLVFIIWDRKQPAKALSRQEISRGFIPGYHARWGGFLTLALAGLALALKEFDSPSLPPFSGKGSTIQALAYEAFGPHGTAFLWLGAGAAFAAAAAVSYRSTHKPS